jgi:hypothetical protein
VSTDPFAFAVLLVVQFGFAALLGSLAGHPRQTLDKALVVACLALYAAASWALPFSLPLKLTICAVSTLLLLGFRDSDFVFYSQPRAAWLYAAFGMLLIVAWSLGRAAHPPFVALAAAAVLAAGLAWRRSSLA